MKLCFEAPALVTVPIVDQEDRFPVNRIYCVGRNYEAHAKEMGGSGREPPFFFMKPVDALLVVSDGEIGSMEYPQLTRDLHHEVELVVAIGKGGCNIKVVDALDHVFGYAVGLDMTRRDLQNKMKVQGWPWEVGKAFDQSAPISPIIAVNNKAVIASTEVKLSVNGDLRQIGRIDELIWNIAEIIEHISDFWTLKPGDLIFTGTPAGVAAVGIGDVMVATITGIGELKVCIKSGYHQ
jgi:fumarylpyruvate hydrolase